jgi:NAD(P)H-flavin reductase
MTTALAQPTADLAAADPMRPSLQRVERVRRETHDTFTLELRPVEARGHFAFAPGQFNMLYAFGVGECAISISSAPTAGAALAHTTRMVGTVTKALYRLKTGDVLGIRGPFGTAWPLREAEKKDVIFVAGGIGLAPLRPAMCQVLANRSRFGKVVLLYGARTPQDILFRRELERWRTKLDIELYVTVDRAESGWQGNVGVVTMLIQRAPFDRLNCVAMVCGPEVMMHFTVLELIKRGVKPESIYLSMERNMKCATGFCGHCQFGPFFVCKDGPVFRYDRIKHWLEQREL